MYIQEFDNLIGIFLNCTNHKYSDTKTQGYLTIWLGV